jgi:hypothetical protein
VQADFGRDCVRLREIASPTSVPIRHPEYPQDPHPHTERPPHRRHQVLDVPPPSGGDDNRRELASSSSPSDVHSTTTTSL